MALQPKPNLITSASATQDVPIKDLKKSRLDVEVAQTTALKDIKVAVNIEHTYIGDLVVSVVPPPALGLPKITLHNRAGGGTDNLKVTYDKIKAPGLLALVGRSPKGKWTLEVEDKAEQDTGMIRSFSLELHF